MNPFQRISMAAFTALFARTNVEVARNKAARFTKFLHAAVSGTLFARPDVKPTWVAHFDYHPPMPFVDQLSYDDVESELQVMRNKHLDKKVLFIGGDGLSIHRLNWCIMKSPDVYVESTPLIIPVQGEAPHGIFHVLHAGWRLYIRFIRWCAGKLGRNQKTILDDPKVSDYNSHMFFLIILTRACSEYVAELLRTGGPGVDMPDELLQEASNSPALKWVLHFLHDFAFLVLQFKQSVRSSDGECLDVLWREFFSLGHTSTANKTLYVPMAVMRVWYGKVLSPPLKRLYQSARSIPLTDAAGSMTGWDMPIERLNAYITSSVKVRVSPESIARAVRECSLLTHNYQIIKAGMEYDHFMKDIDKEVEKLKSELTSLLGSTWREARSKTASAPWTTSQNQRGMAPWDEVNNMMTRSGNDSVANVVAKHARNLTKTYYSFMP